MRYHDLSIEIRPDPRLEGQYEAHVTSTTYGSARASFSIPGTALPLERIIESLERRVVHSRLLAGDARELSMEDGEDGEPADSPDPRSLGEDLFGALFRGEAAEVFHASLGSVEGSGADDDPAGDADQGLRVRLVFDLADADLSELAVLPWELLRRSEQRQYLARFRKTPVVRSLKARGPIRPIRVRDDLRVLLAEAAPEGVRRLDTPLEVSGVRGALEGIPRVRVTHLDQADLPRLSDELVWGRHHVLHFMGHGGFDPGTGEAVLCFEGPGRKLVRVPAALFAEHVKQSSTIRLVVLNACATAKLPRLAGGQNPFTAAAAALAMAGVPAVVAMQFPISDPAAITFATSFYKGLAHSDPIDAAVSTARLAVRSADLRPEGATLEWVTPVLYLRGADAQLLDIEPEPPAGGQAHPRDPVQSSRPPGGEERPPLRLGIRSLEGLGLELESEADRVLSLVDYFEGRHIRDEALWYDRVLPELAGFLAEGVASHRPLIVDLAAHQSLAFAAGSVLESKSGVEISIVQRGQGPPLFWPAQPGVVPDGPLWHEAASVVRDEAVADIAVAVSATWDIVEDVGYYLDQAGLSVGRILHVAIAPEPSRTSVLDGPHALRLAQTLGRVIRARPIRERLGTVHLFASAPNALVLFLGQLAPALGRVQLYEYDFEKRQPGAYWPSFEVSERSFVARSVEVQAGS
jgi:hypothetical protein